MALTISDIKVSVKIIDSERLLAVATVVVGGVIETKGWRIMKSNRVHERFQEQVWIQPPSHRHGINDYKPTVFVGDTTLYQEIEESIYNAYLEARRRTPPANQ